jgi:hypothetical protein
MPKLSLWNSGRRDNDHNFINRHNKEYFFISGTCVYLAKYLGPHTQGGMLGDEKDATITDNPNPTETTIQDILFLENRDRKYSQETYELRACYNVQDNEFDLRAQGLFLTNDSLFLEFHTDSVVDSIGRKIMPGDVLELPHLRDDLLLDKNDPALNKWYVVKDVNRAAGGFGSTWYSYTLRVKVEPMTVSQEFKDILQREIVDADFNPTGFTLAEILGNNKALDKINVDLVKQANEDVNGRYFDTRQFWFVPGADESYPWIFCGDGIPPNGATLLGSGTSWPFNPTNGDYFFRTDYQPPKGVLFQFKDGAWIPQEVNHRGKEWKIANQIRDNFINNDEIETAPDGTKFEQKIALNNAIKPRANF